MRKALFTIALVLASAILPAQEKIALKHGPYLQNLTGTEVTIVWIASSNSVGWVELAPDDGSNFYDTERPKFWDARNGIKTEGRVHTVKLTGLKPGTTYRYRAFAQEVLEHKGNVVLYGKIAAGNVYTKKPLSFTTCDPSKTSVSFAMVNDIHGKNDRLRTLLSQCDFSKTDQVMMVGDMASMFNSEDQVFGDFMDTAVEIFASETPMYYTRGNHETRGAIAYHFQDYFSPKSEHIYYMFRQGPVVFVALDCGEDKPDSDIEYFGANVYDEYRSEQAEWLKKIVQTEEYKSAPFKIVTCHMPPLSNWHGELDLQEKWLPILNEADVDVMLCGHHHKLIHKNAGEVAAFPVIANSNDTILKGEATSSKLTLVITDESGKKVDELIIRK